MEDSAVGPRKERHGCLTAYLILMVVVNSLMAVVYLLGADAIKHRLPNTPNWALPVLGVLGVVNVICAIALFRWKIWGFWGFVISALIAFVVNLSIGLPVARTLFGLFIGVGILYGALHIGKDRSAWPQLE